jgi:signal transduction histidine kinase
MQRRPVTLKNLEEVLVSAKLFGTVLGNAGTVLTLIDSEFNLIYVNYKGESIFKELHNREYDFLGKKCYEAFRKGLHPCPGCKTAETIKTKEPARNFVVHNKLVDRVFSINAYPITDMIEGKIQTVAVLEVAQDVTAQHLAAGKAHDANNLMTGIVGPLSYVQLCVGHGRVTFEEVADQIDVAEKSAARVGTLMLDLQQILSGKSDWEHYTRAPIDLRRILEDTAGIFKVQYKDIGAKIILDCQDVPQISGHQKGLESVFENIIRNAFDAFNESSIEQPTLTARVYHTPGSNGGYIHTEFEDNGPGIPVNLQDKIFDFYFTTKATGQGIGLPNSKLIIEKRHFGEMRVSSTEGQGAKFEIIIPDPTRLKYLQQKKK